ncbi:hypothetical protein D3C80_1267570 [compost metagenome]
MILIGGDRGGQRRVAPQITDLYLGDGIVLLSLRHGGEGIDMALLQRESTQLLSQAGQRRFEGLHLLTQGGGRGKGVHRLIL